MPTAEKYAPGDLVRAVRPIALHEGLPPIAVGDVFRVHRHDAAVEILRNDTDTQYPGHGWSPRCFELVARAGEVPSFQVGDEVQILVDRSVATTCCKGERDTVVRLIRGLPVLRCDRNQDNPWNVPELVRLGRSAPFRLVHRPLATPAAQQPEITVTISGAQGAGKSVVHDFVLRQLRDAGARVTAAEGENDTYPMHGVDLAEISVALKVEQSSSANLYMNQCGYVGDIRIRHEPDVAAIEKATRCGWPEVVFLPGKVEVRELPADDEAVVTIPLSEVLSVDGHLTAETTQSPTTPEKAAAEAIRIASRALNDEISKAQDLGLQVEVATVPLSCMGKPDCDIPTVTVKQVI